MVWDQAEADIECGRNNAVYTCLQRQLVMSYRAQFNSTFPFVGVQLPGYVHSPISEHPVRIDSSCGGVAATSGWQSCR